MQFIWSRLLIDARGSGFIQNALFLTALSAPAQQNDSTADNRVNILSTLHLLSRLARRPWPRPQCVITNVTHIFGPPALRGKVGLPCVGRGGAPPTVTTGVTALATTRKAPPSRASPGAAPSRNAAVEPWPDALAKR
ncbi:hypothetical protein GGTG_02541 [Gaeumannomyces tritici R3-111a-1]|uniref:Uncharacterized protein n=1 Tax=Gaeumannomyces tritici (strain R3-111a-1) TaxID=644352 RepID=J3NMN5_GAET3|nr:hypothetical protein GGTG_02541 [Gaeumannomyces tritici R3-111a-1]EJT82568.1 hypothetical protein GGTG_02541 [Gaeumannomyces tritici R3-111a-1]